MFFNKVLVFPSIKKTMISREDYGSNWRGVPISEIYGSDSPWNVVEFPLVSPSHNHTVLYHIPASGFMNDRPPKPQIGKDRWDHDFVRMPCSNQSLYPVEDRNGVTQLKKRWEIIESALSKPMNNSQDLAAAIFSYNTKFKNKWRFKGLHKLFNEYLEEEESTHFFHVMLPEIAKLALALPRLIQSPIPLLKQNKNHSISLSQQQISSLLANAFFCTFPRRNTTKRTSEYASFPHINFNGLYESCSDTVMEKLKCICHYFKRVCTKVPVGAVTFSRRVGRDATASGAEWLRDTTSLGATPLHVHPHNTIEDAHGLIQLDFANKYLGGGVLGYGCVQEEIRFVISPELMVSMLFTEVLRHNEAVMIIGCERYSSYHGYADSFRWAGEFHELAPRDSSARRRVAVLALDALPYNSLEEQYKPRNIIRELNKAWVGMSWYTEGEGSSRLQYPGLATGNWGCGAFGGSPHLKSLLQLMACARAKRPLAYFTFDDLQLRDDLIGIYNVLSRYNVTVGQLYKYIMRFAQTDVRKSQLHAFIMQAIKDDELAKAGEATAEESKTLDASEAVLSDSLQREFLNVSPDLFSSDSEINAEKEQIDSPNEIELDGKMMSDYKIASDNKITSKDEMVSDDKVASPSVSHTSRLCDEIQKVEVTNSEMNFSVPRLSPFNHIKIGTAVSCNSMDVEINQELDKPGDMPIEVKKRITRKITDYFSRKPT